MKPNEMLAEELVAEARSLTDDYVWLGQAGLFGAATDMRQEAEDKLATAQRLLEGKPPFDQDKRSRKGWFRR